MLKIFLCLKKRTLSLSLCTKFLKSVFIRQRMYVMYECVHHHLFMSQLVYRTKCTFYLTRAFGLFLACFNVEH
jgi:hypothetical protein